jgi:mannose-6-phosphate isomerase class I
MGRDLELALDVFNLAPLTAADVESRIRCRPRRRREFAGGSFQEELIGAAQTDCFRVTRTRLAGPVVKDENSAVVAIVISGNVILDVGGRRHRFRACEKFFLPAALGPVKFIPESQAEILECFPPA